MTVTKEDLQLPVNMLTGATAGLISDPKRPGGMEWIDLWLDSNTRPDDPGRTMRFRLRPENLVELLDTLNKAQALLTKTDAAKPRH